MKLRTLLSLLPAPCALAAAAHAQLPAPPEPVENPVTPEKAVLGKILFWDEQLSSDNTVACGTCHFPSSGGSDPRSAVSVNPGSDGIFGNDDDILGSTGVIRADANDEYVPDPTFGFLPRTTGRNAPNYIMGAYFQETFWDGRAGDTFLNPDTGLVSIATGGALENQAVGPPLSSVEMAHTARSWSQITTKLALVPPLNLASNLPPDVASALAVNPTYPELFAAAFGDPAITAERIAFAIATHERTLVPDQTPFDEFFRGDPLAMTSDQVQGFLLTSNKGNCTACHSFQFQGAPPTKYTNTGLRPPDEDLGRQNVTGNPADRGKFKVPLLWNVGLRPQMFHNGAFDDLADVIDFYNRGGDFSDNKDFQMVPLGLTPTEKAQMLDFLQNALTDPRVAAELPPFDRPALASESPALLPDVVAPGTAGTGGFTPTTIANNPPALSSPDYKLGVAEGLGGAEAFLTMAGPIGFQPRALPMTGGPAGTPLFRPRIHILDRLTLDGAGPGGGYATVHFPIPGNASLIGLRVQARWIVKDPGGVGGFARSDVVELELF